MNRPVELIKLRILCIVFIMHNNSALFNYVYYYLIVGNSDTELNSRISYMLKPLFCVLI